MVVPDVSKILLSMRVLIVFGETGIEFILIRCMLLLNVLIYFCNKLQMDFRFEETAL
jgi:hypothetical protein